MFGWYCRDCGVSGHAAVLYHAESLCAFGSREHWSHDFVIKPCNEVCPAIGNHLPYVRPSEEV